MRKNSILYIAPGVFFGLTLVAGVFLSSGRVLAEESAVDNVTVTVPEACTITTPAGTGQTYNVAMTNGQYKNDIGKTRLSVFCNTEDSFSIYAVGYSGDIFGNTEMIASASGAANILTGTATSGSNSNWAMKLEAVNGTGGAYTPSIISPFNNFAAVPSSYAKVAEVTSVTGATAEAAIDASYAVYLSLEQAAGTYTGKVRYTVVHPSSAVPNQPYDTETGKIGYYPNGDGLVADTMGDQSISNTATSATLWASNFKRADYGFVGWSDKYDWVVNENDANGDGTGANAGYHIYGPNQTINFTAGQYGTGKGLSLYAVWVKSQGTIQNWNGCGAMSVGQVTALTDTRDGNTYAVAKLRDDANDATSGKCWMIENLRLGGTTAMTLDSDTTNIADGTTFTLSASTDPTQTAWCTNNDANCYDQSMLASNNTTNTKTNMTSAALGSSESTGIYSMGNYYNWYSATAGTGTYPTSTNNTSVTSDICPKGWRLARGGNNQNTANNDFLALSEAAIGSKPANYDTSTYPSYTETPEGTNASNKLKAYPNNFIYSGNVYSSSVGFRGSYGSYWSSTVGGSSHAYYLYLGSSVVYPGTDNNVRRFGGFVVRCVAGS